MEKYICDTGYKGIKVKGKIVSYTAAGYPIFRANDDPYIKGWSGLEVVVSTKQLEKNSKISYSIDLGGKDMIIRSNIDGNGRETMSICVRCILDSRNICNGTKIVLVNDHKHNSYLIYKSTTPMGYKELQKGSGETLELVEFEKWLEENGYSEDEQACKEARESKLN